MARRTVPLVHAQRILGHLDSKATAQIYSPLDLEDLRAAVEGAAAGAEVQRRKAVE